MPLTCLPACLSLPACPQDSGHSPSFSPALIDYFMLRSMSSVRLPYNAAHPIPVVGRLSPQEEAMLSMQQAKRTRTLDSDDWEDAKRRPGPLQLARHHLFANSQVGGWVGGWADLGRLFRLHGMLGLCGRGGSSSSSCRPRRQASCCR